MDGGATNSVTPDHPAADGAVRPGRRRVPRRTHVVAVVAVVVALIASILASRALSSPHPSIELGARTPGYLVSRDELHDRAARAAAGEEPYASAVADLLQYANDTVDAAPSPQQPLEIDETEGPFVDDTAAAYGLALAWSVTGEERYADAAAGFMDAWVRTTSSTLGTCPDDGSCQTSLIVGRTAAGFVFAADLLRGTSAFPAADETAFRQWLARVILPTASVLPNNWGDAGTFLRIVATDYLGERDGLKAAIDTWFVQQDRVAADGHIPEETRRGSEGMSYTQEALQYRVGAAVIAERYGLDLWTYRGTGGATLWDAIDYLAGYWSKPETWPWDTNAERPSTGPFWELAFQRSRDPRFIPIIEERRPFGRQGHSALRWTTLTNGISLEERPTAVPST